MTVFFIVGRNPTISTSSPTFTLPCSIRPAWNTTVPRPEIENISSIGTSQTACLYLCGGSGMPFVYRVHQFPAPTSPTSFITFQCLPAPTRESLESLSPGN